MKAWLQFGSGVGPFQTVAADDCRELPLWYHDRGLQQTASGYGSKLRQPWQIRYRGRWLRVYCVCWSNSGTNYVIVDKTRVVVTIERD